MYSILPLSRSRAYRIATVMSYWLRVSEARSTRQVMATALRRRLVNETCSPSPLPSDVAKGAPPHSVKPARSTSPSALRNASFTVTVLPAGTLVEYQSGLPILTMRPRRVPAPTARAWAQDPLGSEASSEPP